MNKLASFTSELLKPVFVRLFGGVIAFLAIYDTVSSQFGPPRLLELFGWTGRALPLWAWLVGFQFILFASLAGFVARVISFPFRGQNDAIEDFSTDLRALEKNTSEQLELLFQNFSAHFDSKVDCADFSLFKS